MRMSTFLAAAVVAAGAVSTGPAAAQSNVPLIPREILFGNPSRASPRLSPDGTKLSFLAPVNGVLNVWVGPTADPDAAEPVTFDQGRGIRVYFWAYTNEHILYLQDDAVDGNMRLYTMDTTTGRGTALTPESAPDGHKVNARIERVSRKYPRDLIVGLNIRDPRYHDLFVLNIDTGELVELQRNEGFIAFHTDDDFNVRLATRLTPDGGNELLVQTEMGQWEPFTTIPMEDLFATGPVEFDQTAEHVYMLDSRGRDTAALKSIELKSGTAKTLVKNRDADVSGGILIHPTEKTVQAASYTYERREWDILDKSLKADFKYLEDLVDGELSVVSRTLDDTQWIVAFEDDDGPVRYFLYDRIARNATFLFPSRDGLEGLSLAEMHVETVKSRDRMSLVTYYTLPPWTDPRGKGRPDDRLPTVVWVHGGPWARASWGYDPVHQWLANRGYAVISVNFRGSSGFGKKFVNAANREWGGKMQEDLLDVIEWAVKKKITDRDHIAIMGGSYGGYAVLAGLAFAPETFACGVDIAGPPNLVSFLETIPPYWQPTVDLWAARVGDHRTEDGRAFLQERSPLGFVDQITRPLLIAHGEKDPRVAKSEVDQMVAALERNAVPVTYALYSDEGHGLARPENRMSFYAVAETFLERHMGGRLEPIGDDLDGSTIRIKGDQIAGVTGR